MNTIFRRAGVLLAVVTVILTGSLGKVSLAGAMADADLSPEPFTGAPLAKDTDLGPEPFLEPLAKGIAPQSVATTTLTQNSFCSSGGSVTNSSGNVIVSLDTLDSVEVVVPTNATDSCRESIKTLKFTGVSGVTQTLKIGNGLLYQIPGGSNPQLTSVRFEAAVPNIEIGENAFRQHSPGGSDVLAEVLFPATMNNLSISHWAFYQETGGDSALVSVTFPTSVNNLSIGQHAFHQKSTSSNKLANVRFPAAATGTVSIGDWSFAQEARFKNTLASVSFAGETLSSLTIGGHAFRQIINGESANSGSSNGLSAITFPDSVTTLAIGEEAFEQQCSNSANSLLNITFPAQVTTMSIGSGAFYQRAEGSAVGNSPTASTYWDLVFPDSLTSLTIGDNAFRQGAASGDFGNTLRSVKFPRNLPTLSIGAWAFAQTGRGPNALQSVVFPQGTVSLSIGASAFWQESYVATNALSKVTFPSSLTALSIGNGAFGQKSGSSNTLASVLFPQGLTTLDIGASAFAQESGTQAPALSSVVFPSSLTSLTIGERAFQQICGGDSRYSTALAEVAFPGGMTALTIGEKAFAQYHGDPIFALNSFAFATTAAPAVTISLAADITCYGPSVGSGCSGNSAWSWQGAGSTTTAAAWSGATLSGTSYTLSSKTAQAAISLAAEPASLASTFRVSVGQSSPTSSASFALSSRTPSICTVATAAPAVSSEVVVTSLTAGNCVLWLQKPGDVTYIAASVDLQVPLINVSYETHSALSSLSPVVVPSGTLFSAPSPTVAPGNALTGWEAKGAQGTLLTEADALTVDTILVPIVTESIPLPITAPQITVNESNGAVTLTITKTTDEGTANAAIRYWVASGSAAYTQCDTNTEHYLTKVDAAQFTETFTPAQDTPVYYAICALNDAGKFSALTNGDFETHKIEYLPGPGAASGSSSTLRYYLGGSSPSVNNPFTPAQGFVFTTLCSDGTLCSSSIPGGGSISAIDQSYILTVNWRHATPNFAIDFANEKLVGLGSNYTVDGVGATAETILEEWMDGEDHTIVRKPTASAGDAGFVAASEAQSLQIPARPATPTLSERVSTSTADQNDGRIAGVNSSMEFSFQESDIWTGVAGSAINQLSPGVYWVRVKQAGSNFKSGKTSVTVDPFEGNDQVVVEGERGQTSVSAQIADGNGGFTKLPWQVKLVASEVQAPKDCLEDEPADSEKCDAANSQGAFEFAAELLKKGANWTNEALFSLHLEFVSSEKPELCGVAAAGSEADEQVAKLCSPNKPIEVTIANDRFKTELAEFADGRLSVDHLHRVSPGEDSVFEFSEHTPEFIASSGALVFETSKFSLFGVDTLGDCEISSWAALHPECQPEPTPPFVPVVPTPQDAAAATIAATGDPANLVLLMLLVLLGAAAVPRPKRR